MKTVTAKVKTKIVKNEEKKQKKQTKKAKTKKRQTVLKVRCPICFNNISNEAVSATHCGHVFCTRCLEKALLVKPVCPTCRKSLRKAKAYHALYLNINIHEEEQDNDSC